MRFLSSTGSFGALALVLVGCGASLFGSEGIGAFTADEQRFFEGCEFVAKGGASTWKCGHGESQRVVEHGGSGAGQDAAVAAFNAAHPENGAMLGRREAQLTFTSGGKSISNAVSVVKHKGKMTMIAAGPAPEATGPVRSPFYAACTFPAPEEVTSISDGAGLGVSLTLCKNSVEAVLGVVNRHHP